MAKTYLPQDKNGMMSVVKWELNAHFRTKEQARNFISSLLKETISFEFDYSVTRESVVGMADIEVHTVQISTMPWADNLLQVAKLLKEVDCDFGEDD